ncbi:MAG: dipeptide/tripeptide permease [Planctomycetota bacterium]|jgi:dipeptide/tripeptide permease
MSDSSSGIANQGELFGHPCGLFTLFFAEMWERFSYYGMRALLTLYMIKGFLGYGDGQAFAVYGAYTALVYATPFIGGMIADRLLGARKSVVLGGILMALGHLVMMKNQDVFFFGALALLIVGNGFFKPNISTIVGELYGPGDERRDRGFTIFYMGINLGAAIAPLLCGWVGETYGWHWGFGLATVGMLTGLAVFWAPRRIAQGLIMVTSVATSGALIWTQSGAHPALMALYAIVAVALIISAGVAFVALSRGGIPDDAGRPRDPEAASRKVFGLIRADVAVYLGVAISIPIFALLVQKNEIAGYILSIFGAVAFGYLIVFAFKAEKVARERMFVVLIMMFFSLLFWAFFEQAGSSVNLFTDRNVDRVLQERVVTEDEIGKTIVMRTGLVEGGEHDDLPILSQEQLGLMNGNAATNLTASEVFIAGKTRNLDEKAKTTPTEDIGAMEKLAKERTNAANTSESLKTTPYFSMTALTALRDSSREKDAKESHKKIDWKVTKDNVGMGVGGSEIPASVFQAINPIYIILFGLVFTWLWSFMSARGREPSTPFKFALGLLQLGLGFGAFWYGAHTADSRGMSGMSWIFLGYLLQTTGELCLSPVGLSMVTKLSPKAIVSTVMGAWFLATAFSNYLAGMIAKLTGVSHGGGEGSGVLPAPIDTVNTYGDVFGKIAIAAMISALICFALVPVLKRWMHEDEPQN